jgi:hypothetical protein
MRVVGRTRPQMDRAVPSPRLIASTLPCDQRNIVGVDQDLAAEVGQFARGIWGQSDDVKISGLNPRKRNKKAAREALDVRLSVQRRCAPD